LTKEFPFELNANQSDIRLVNFFVPSSALAGKYDVTYHVNSREFPSHSDLCTVQISVLPALDLTVTLLEAPEYVIAGESYQVAFLVTNGCNIPDQVDVDITNKGDYPTSITHANYSMPPGGSEKITVTVQTDKELQYSLKHNVELLAKLHTNEKIRSKAYSAVEIVPRTTGEDDRYHRIPVEASIRTVYQKRETTRTGFQGNISGEGSLDEEGKKNIKFRLRGPDIYDTSILAERDEYFISYFTKRVHVAIGDKFYSLSPLTERNRYGRGVETEINSTHFSFGAFYQQTRWARPQKEEIGSHFYYSFKPDQRIGLNYMNKQISGEAQSHILSLDSRFHPLKNSDLELEYALDKTGSKNESSYRILIAGQHSIFSYRLNYISASPDFQGYYRDTDYLSANVSLRLIRALSVNANIRKEKQNFELDTTRYSAPLTEYYQAGLRYRLGTQTSLNLDYYQRSREDRMPDPKFNYQERMIRLTASQGMQKFSFYATAELGKTSNRVLDEIFNSQRYTLSAHYRPSSSQYYRGYIYYDDNSRSTGEQKGRLTIGVNASVKIASRTSFYVNLQTDYSDEEYYHDRNIFDLQLRHTFSNNHVLSMQGRHTLLRNSLDNDETAVMLSYTVPFGIPLSRKKSTGVVKGYVYDEETKEPIKDLIIRINGSTAVTDKEGYFIFPSLLPKTYYLSLDKTRIGFNRVPAQKTPIQVEVAGGSSQSVDLGITTGAMLYGRVMVYVAVQDTSAQMGGGKTGSASDEYYLIGFGNGNLLKNSKDLAKKGLSVWGDQRVQYREDYGLVNILVELEMDGEIHRRMTDKKGCFSFEELRPGKWNVRVYPYNLPENHQLENELFNVELKPNDQHELTVRVLPKKRKIRMLQEGGTIIEEPLPGPGPGPGPRPDHP
jgi:hypothetical protein